MKDIGVMNYEKHINSKIETANKLLGIVRPSYMFLNCEIFVPIYKALVRSHFDYAMTVCNPHMVKHIESIEGVQPRATQMIPEIKNLSYTKRCDVMWCDNF